MGDETIHPNLSFKTADAVLLILSYYIRHNLTWTALSNLLTLISILLGDQSTLPKTKHMFKKIFGKDIKPQFHFYCRKCRMYIGTLEELNNLSDVFNCGNCGCDFTLEKMNHGCFFIYIPLKHQIEEMIRTNPNILHHDTSASADGSIRDIFDGKQYKKLKSTFDQDTTLITLTGNTDGVRIFKSKRKASLWPVQFFINENSISDRFKRHNIMLSNIWFGTDPDFCLYLKPLIQELKQFSIKPLILTIAGTTYKIAVRLFLMTADTPARCKLLAMKMFNGAYGCTYCIHPGVMLEGSTNNSKYNKRRCCKRIHSDTVNLMKAFANFNVEELGVIGISPLLGVPDFDLIIQCPIDWMHCVLLGVTNALMELWFHSNNHREKYYLPPIKRAIVERRISRITPLQSFTRQARSVEERNFWKANELRNWLFYYSKPCLKGVLNSKYFDHFCLLSESIYLLSQTNITKSMFEEASRKLCQFTTQYERYYGLQHMVYNVHLLDHIPDCVEECGPLWAYSNFNFEDNNGHLAAYVQGTNSVEKQILSKIYYDGIVSKFVDKSVPLQNYVKLLNNTHVKKCERIGDITLFGKPNVHNCNEEEREIIGCSIIYTYKKMFYNGDVFFPRSKKVKRTNDTLFKLKDGTFAEIVFIFKNEKSSVKIVIKKLKLLDPHNHSHLRSIAFTNDTTVLEAEDVLEKCVFIATGSEMFLSERPNHCERD